jgi:hypothetical protein
MKRIVVALGGVLFLLVLAQANALFCGAQDYLAAQSDR